MKSRRRIAWEGPPWMRRAHSDRLGARFLCRLGDNLGSGEPSRDSANPAASPRPTREGRADRVGGGEEGMVDRVPPAHDDAPTRGGDPCTRRGRATWSAGGPIWESPSQSVQKGGRTQDQPRDRRLAELLRGADRQEHHPREGRPAIGEDGPTTGPPAGVRRGGRSSDDVATWVISRRSLATSTGMVSRRRWWFELLPEAPTASR
jgi:hypothetical protein